MQNNISVIKYTNCIEFKMLNKRILCWKKKDNKGVKLVFKRLIIAPKSKQKSFFIEQDNDSTTFKFRKHSKYCVWVNEIDMSLEAYECIYKSHSLIDLIDEIEP